MTRDMENAKVCMVNDNEEVRELTSEPKVTCARCGATANHASNVCVPIER